MKFPLLFITAVLFAGLSVSSGQWSRDFPRSTDNTTGGVNTPGVIPAPAADQQRKTRPDYSVSATVAQTTSMDVLNDTIKLNDGDIISYRVVEDGKEPIPIRVGDSGDVEVPLIGRVEAKDKTCRQLAYDIKAQLEKSFYRRATVILGIDVLGGKSKGKITIMGDVHNQGEMDIPADETFTMSKVILRAGGLGDFANMRKIKLIRKTPEGYRSYIVDLKPVFRDGRLDRDPPVEPGDTIIVPEKIINF